MAGEELAEMYEAFPGRTHLRLDDVEAELAAWFAGSAWEGWSASARGVAAHRLGELAARCYPDAQDPLACAQLLAWVTVLDDIVETPVACADPVVRALPGALLGDLPPGLWGGGSPARVLSELWPALTRGMTPAWQRRMRTHVADCFRVEERWDVSRRADVAPGFDTYVAGRREDGAFIVGLDLVEFGLGENIPEEIFHDPAFRQLWTATADIVVWTNDLLSADREIAAGASINLVRVLEGEGRSRSSAVAESLRILEKRIFEFFEAASQLRLDHDDGDEAARTLDRWVDGLQWTVRGLYDWSVSTTRYGD